MEGLTRLKDRAIAVAEQTVANVPMPGAPRKEGWSDALLREKDSVILFPGSCLTRLSYKNILNNFWSFYFDGQNQPSVSTFQIIADIIAIIPIETPNNEFGKMWDANHFTDAATDGFYKRSNEVQELTEQAPVAFRAPRLEGMLVNPENEEGYAIFLQYYTAQSQSTFKNKIRAEINSCDFAQAMTLREFRLLRLSGFLALTFCRSVTKDIDQLNNAFMKKQYQQNIAALIPEGGDFEFCPPCERAVTMSVNTIKKGTSLPASLITKIVARGVVAQINVEDSQHIYSYLAASFLTHTAFNGIGLVSLVSMACRIMECGWLDLYTVTNEISLSTAWQRLINFYETYLRQDQLQYGYPWARVIHDGFLRDLAPKENFGLASVCAGIIEQEQGDGIMAAIWTREKAAKAERYTRLGIAIYRYYVGAGEPLRGDRETNEMIDRARDIPVPQRLPIGQIVPVQARAARGNDDDW